MKKVILTLSLVNCLLLGSELIKDTNFSHGFNLLGTVDGTSTPIGKICRNSTSCNPSWRLAEWYSQISLAGSSPGNTWGNSYKSVSVSGNSITLAVNGISENYTGTHGCPTIANFPSLLLEQYQNQSLAPLSSLRLKLNADLEYFQKVTSNDCYATQITFYLLVQYNKPGSNINGFWYGIPIFDNRFHSFNSEPQFDKRTQMWMYKPYTNNVLKVNKANGSIQTNHININQDLLPNFLNIMQEKGFDKNYLTIKAFNIGWENPSNNVATIKLSNLSLFASEGTNADTELILTDAEMQHYWETVSHSVHNGDLSGKFYTFTLLKPKKVIIDLTSSIDTYMYLLDGNGKYGNILDEDDNSGNGTNSQITKILPAGTYTVEATAYATNDVTPLSIKVNTYDIPTTPSKPTDIQTSSITTNSVVLNWNDTSNNELGFKIYQGSTYVTTVTANTTSYTLTNLDDNTHYTYTIISYNDEGDSESSTVSFTTPLAKPFMPSNLKVSNIDTTSATLTWQDNADNESGFRLYKNNVLIATLAPNTTTYKITGLETRETYNYRIKAVNDAGYSDSIDLSFTTKDDYAWLIPIYHIILN